MNRNYLIVLTKIFLLLLPGFSSKANVTLPQIVGSNMVLQQKKPVPVWGYAAAGEAITVTFGRQVKKTVTDASGHWKIILDPIVASAQPAEMIIAGTNTIRLKNILVGEVWLCSGQSNMEYTMRKNSKVVKTKAVANDPVDELDRAQNPDIRIFLVDRKLLSKPDTLHDRWSIARDSALRSFSAAGYFFAKELNSKLHVPVGVISSAVPGSAIEPWMPGTVQKEESNHEELQLDTTSPGKFYPTMIQPLAPFALKGFLWYQGETNCFQNENIEYTYKLQALIQSWRHLWNDENLPFYFVQIAPFYYSKSKGKYDLNEETEPRFWEAQALALHIPHTGMIVTTDLVNTPDDLHPGYKWEIGRRLAQWPLAKDYHQNIVPSGPLFKSMKVKGNEAEIEFDYTGSGLINKDGKTLTWFEIAGSDGQFVPASAIIKGNKVVVSSKDVVHPVAVRFAWSEAAKPNLYNKEGLPAAPFRTNNPLTEKFVKK
jgi:sialate O-acetylesterase